MGENTSRSENFPGVDGVFELEQGIIRLSPDHKGSEGMLLPAIRRRIESSLQGKSNATGDGRSREQETQSGLPDSLEVRVGKDLLDEKSPHD